MHCCPSFMEEKTEPGELVTCARPTAAEPGAKPQAPLSCFLLPPSLLLPLCPPFVFFFFFPFSKLMSHLKT